MRLQSVSTNNFVLQLIVGVLSSAAISALVVDSALAMPKKPTQNTSCPRFIAEKKGEIYYPRENYRCFSTAREAERAGLYGTRAVAAPNYSGWWRWNISLAANSCGGPTSIKAPTTYFLQLKQDSVTGLFGSLCPGDDTFIGAPPSRDPEVGFTITSTTRINSDPFCDGRAATISYVFEAREFDIFFTESSSATLTQIKTCDEDETRRCRSSWKGGGGRESTDHRFWPQVSSRPSDLSNNCRLALTTCQGCHAAPE